MEAPSEYSSRCLGCLALNMETIIISQQKHIWQVLINEVTFLRKYKHFKTFEQFFDLIFEQTHFATLDI